MGKINRINQHSEAAPARVRRLPLDPPGGGPNNEDRADWGMAAVATFAEYVRAPWSGSTQEDVGDLLADLFHFADRAGLDMDGLIAGARETYAFEVAESRAARKMRKDVRENIEAMC
jgi:hypothetical protein